MDQMPKYFLYSQRQHNENIKVYEELGKKYVCGYIVMRGQRHLFTQISEKPVSNIYTDSRIVLETQSLEDVKYKQYKIVE